MLVIVLIISYISIEVIGYPEPSLVVHNILAFCQHVPLTGDAVTPML